ncbi:flagellar hook assembly protein FlgD, partial [Klebsiella variicola]|uniref:flagellar hook assembly protein FlgD n=1 Tax=Klebsiella variicola TaxID=244366 RepID=UPI00272F8F84
DTENKPEITFTTDRDAASVQLIVKDSAGVTVATITKEDVKAGVNTVKWDGKDNLGNRAPEGYYTVEAVAINSEGDSFTPSLSLIGTVT